MQTDVVLDFRFWILDRPLVRRPWPVIRDPLNLRCKERLTTDKGPSGSLKGFTLLELMIVMTLILILATIAVPAYMQSIRRSREAVLRDDLFTMRKLIDQFTLDKNRPPQSLDELVDEHYLRGGIPKDPMTGSNETIFSVYDEITPAAVKDGRYFRYGPPRMTNQPAHHAYGSKPVLGCFPGLRPAASEPESPSRPPHQRTKGENARNRGK